VAKRLDRNILVSSGLLIQVRSDVVVSGNLVWSILFYLVC